MTCRRHTILHLDDEEALGRCLQELLRDDGYDVHYEPSKTAGYDWVLEHRPDLIISDVHSPGMDGLQFLHWIKRNPVTRRVPFMFLTAFSDLRTAVVSRKLGVDEFITKPFELNDLLAAIGRVLATAWSPSIYPPAAVEEEADLELAPWNLIDGLCRSLSGAWSERICYVGNSGSWASFFVTESGKNLVACCVDRPHSFRKIDARRVLDHHRWMREIGARYGLLIGFFDPDEQTRSFARQLGIEIVGADATRNVLRRAVSPVSSRRTALLDHLQVSLPELDEGTAFTGFALRIEEELARFAGKRFKISTPVSASECIAETVLLSDAGADGGVRLEALSEPGRTIWLERASIWMTLASLWRQGRMDRRFIDERPEHAACLFELLGHVPSIDRDDTLLLLREQPARGAMPKPYVAVLDDNREDRGWMCEFLRSTGYSVIGFESKCDYLELLRSPAGILPNLVITDLHAADLTGEEFIKILRQDERLKQIPVMVVSRHLDEPEILGGLRHMGVTAFLRKPCEPHGLLDAVGRSVSASRP